MTRNQPSEQHNTRALLAQRLYVALVEQRALDSSQTGFAPYAPISAEEVRTRLDELATYPTRNPPGEPEADAPLPANSDDEPPF